MTLAIAGSAITLTSIRGLCLIPGTDDVGVIFVSAGNKFRTYDIATRTQVLSDVTLTNQPTSIAPLTSNLIAVGTSATTAHVVNLSTSEVSNITSLNAVFSATFNGQQIAGDPDNGVAFATSSTTGNLIKILGSPISGSVLSPPWLYGTNATAIMKRPDTDTFIATTLRGSIVEFDDTGRALHQYSIPTVRQFPERDSSSAVATGQYATSLCYFAGYLVVSTSFGQIVMFDHDLGLEVQRFTFCPGSATNLTVPVANSEHTLITCQGLQAGVPGLTIFEYDMFRTPMEPKGKLMPTAGTTAQQYCSIVCSGTNVILGNMNGSSLIFATISDTRAIEYTETNLIDPDTEDNVAGHCIIVDDGGVGESEVMFACPVGVGGKGIPITAGSLGSIGKLGLWGSGQTEKFAWTRPPAEE